MGRYPLLWRKALDDSLLVDSLYYANCNGMPNTDSVVQWVEFTEGSGTTVSAYNGIGATGTFTGTTTTWGRMYVDSLCDSTACSGLYANQVNGSRYRYAFNGMEKDDEFSVEGGHYDFGARIYDSRLGRWLAVDPYFRKYAPISPYCFAINEPLLIVDIDGRVLLDGESEVIVTIDEKTGTATYKHSDGTPVSDRFIKETQPLLDAMVTTETGREAVNFWQKTTTKVTVILDTEHHFDAGYGETIFKKKNRNSTKILMNDHGEPESATVYIFVKEVVCPKNDKKCNENPSGRMIVDEENTGKFYGNTLEEILGATGTHERWHFDPNQIKLDNEEIAEPEQDPSKNLPINSEIKFREEYRKVKNIRGEEWRKNYLENPQKKKYPGMDQDYNVKQASNQPESEKK